MTSARTLLAGCLVAACASGPRAGTVPEPVSPALVEQAQARWPDATTQSLAEGRALFVERCKRCHTLPDRRGYSDERWPEILKVMGPRAKLDPTQHQRVLQFILAERTITGVSDGRASGR